MIRYPILVGKIAERGIKKGTMAKTLGISPRALYNRIYGKVPFTWPEVKTICHEFFPDIKPEVLFAEENDRAAV